MHTDLPKHILSLSHNKYLNSVFYNLLPVPLYPAETSKSILK